MKIILICVCIFWSNFCFAQYGSYENHMLNQSMNSFFYYQTSPMGFSDPNSLSDTNRRGALSDRYHEELEYRSQEHQANQQRLEVMGYPAIQHNIIYFNNIPNNRYYNRQNEFLRYQYNYRRRNGSYLNSATGFRIPYP